MLRLFAVSNNIQYTKHCTFKTQQSKEAISHDYSRSLRAKAPAYISSLLSVLMFVILRLFHEILVAYKDSAPMTTSFSAACSDPTRR
uniref:Uncharacterized protein n=1 Tax=Amphiprion percula TaxID=161767 RepID=A0A3P8TQ26_AMPPE